MDKPRRDEEWKPKGHYNRPPRRYADWGRKVARVAKIEIDDDDLYGMDEADADFDLEHQSERDAERGAESEFARVSAECEELEKELDALVPGSPSYFSYMSQVERETIHDTAEAAREALRLSNPKQGRELIAALQLPVRKAKDAETAAYFERRRVEQECSAIEEDLTKLVGTSDAPVMPPGATAEENERIEELAKEARDHLLFDDANEGRSLVQKLQKLLQSTREAIEQRAAAAQRKLLSDQTATLKARINIESRKLTNEEWSKLNNLRNEAEKALNDPNLSVSQSAVSDLRQAYDQATSNPGADALIARFRQQLDKRNDALVRETYNDCRAAGISPPVERGGEKGYLGDLGLIETRNAKRPQSHYNKIDISGAAREHARQRHTVEGIWEVRGVRTAHPTHVAIFASYAAFEKAATSAPTEVTAWKRGSDSGRVDADKDGVHYQADDLINAIAVRSFYPIGGSQYPRQDVERIVQTAQSEAQFREELANL
jgi:hypothetical protein